jgi:predicted alpha/beta-hydrolase family hydrolase
LVSIPISSKASLEGDLQIPAGAKEGIVLFAHGSGSSRHSPRNKFVAQVLNQGGLATLLIDLLTEEEERVDEQTAQLRFDIDLLTDRLCQVAEWLCAQKTTSGLALGCFGASTGAAGALCAAARLGERVKAVVSRGGRPDLAAEALIDVVSPTLLIVGGNDTVVIGMNEEAFSKLSCVKKMVIIPHATHLFEEKGALEQVAHLALDWFNAYLG